MSVGRKYKAMEWNDLGSGALVGLPYKCNQGRPPRGGDVGTETFLMRRNQAWEVLRKEGLGVF